MDEKQQPTNNTGRTFSEQEIIAATVGERKPMNSTITLAPYDPEWPAMFKTLEKQIRDALGESVMLLEHVGSTSVPGLSAKPIIDMVMAVEDSQDEAAYVPPLEGAGFVLRIREPDFFEHRMLKAPVIAGNLHVFSAGCEEIDTMLLFRDWLRSHPEDMQLYEDTKVKLAARVWKYTQNYADAKGEVVHRILARAQTHRQ